MLSLNLEKISIDDCQQTYDKYFTPNNAILTIVGDIDPLKKLEIINKTTLRLTMTKQ